jgi:glycosyltransferase involved in cell wall biosynthesis
VVRISIKILFISFVSPYGTSGQNISSREIINAFTKNSAIKLAVICPYNSNFSAFQRNENARDIFYLPEKIGNIVYWHIKIQFIVIKKLFLVIKTFHPDIIVTRMNPSLIIPPIIAKYLHIPYILLIRGRLLSENKVYSQNGILKIFTKLSLFVNIRIAKRIIVAFKEIKEEIDKYRKSYQRKSEIFCNAVDPLKFKAISVENAREMLNYSIYKDDFILGFVGSLQDRHCLIELFDAIEEYSNKEPNIKLLLVGEGPLIKKLKNRTEKEGLKKNVIFTGYVKHENVGTYMAACDVLYGVVHPGKASNPIKCYEYLASGRPVITSEKEELIFIKDNKFGIVLDKVDKDNLVKAIDIFYQIGREKRLEMGKKGRQYVFENHTWDKLTDLILKDCLEKE